MLRVDNREARKALRDNYLKCKLISVKQQDTHFRENYKFYHWLDKMLENLQLLFELFRHMTYIWTVEWT